MEIHYSGRDTSQQIVREYQYLQALQALYVVRELHQLIRAEVQLDHSHPRANIQRQGVQ